MVSIITLTIYWESKQYSGRDWSFSKVRVSSLPSYLPFVLLDLFSPYSLAFSRSPAMLYDENRISSQSLSGLFNASYLVQTSVQSTVLQFKQIPLPFCLRTIYSWNSEWKSLFLLLYPPQFRSSCHVLGILILLNTDLYRVVQRLEKSPGLRFPTSRHWTLVARSSSINLGRSTALRIAFG